ncbi:hypothetical protein BKA70DRAFT_1486248 [Coprinopsis sp. MPI-PUGE-AT-0042]|nr:hypothetical protein BKA70DRAFT_1486248 [Coprinopsis sp. MPI-PUGE-AT-0042]
MPSGDPLWYCHECHAEMRPLMVPDPACASCRGSFVEKIENPQDDPRSFAPAGNDIPDDGIAGEVPGIDTFLLTLQALMDRGMSTRPRPRPESSASLCYAYLFIAHAYLLPQGSRFQFHINRGSGSASVAFGGPSTLNNPPSTDPRSNDGVPSMSDFLSRGPSNGPDREATISNQMMAQYLLALLGDRDPLAALLGGVGGAGGPDSGRMGDYVFSQEALDQIITQLMENSNAHRPVPATEEVVEKLPRRFSAALLSEDCAVCKEQFSLETESPDELVAIKLPCKHPFHEPCILPWLKTSGTCPVCRYALIPQPSQPASPPASTSTPSPGNRSPSPPSRRDSGSGGGFLQHLFGHFSGNPGSSTSHQASTSAQHRTSSSNSPSQHRRSSSDSYRGGRRSNNRDHLPGGWEEDLD